MERKSEERFAGARANGVRDFNRVLDEDATEVARRTLRSKFGRLSNARILRVLRDAAVTDAAIARASDEELLARWFDAFAAARERFQADR